MIQQKAYKERPRLVVLSFLASLCAVTGRIQEAEGYLVEMIACVAFTEWDDTAKPISA